MISCSMIESFTLRTVDATVCLHHENITAAHTLAEAGAQFTVGEFDDVRLTELYLQMFSNLGREVGVGFDRCRSPFVSW